MQIYLDITRLYRRLLDNKRPTGVDRVGLAYIAHYGDNARAVLSENGFYIVLSQRDSANAFKSLLAQIRPKPGHLGLVIARTLARLPFAKHPPAGILLHTAHSGVESERYFRSLREHGIRVVFMVHDLIPLTHAEYARAETPAVHARRIDTTLKHASGIIANSHATRVSLENYAAETAQSTPPVATAQLAPAIIDRGEVASPPIHSPYFLMLGTIEPRKNHWLMLHVWRRLVEQDGPRAPKLVIVGRRGWECENVIDMLERCAELRNVVIEKGDCSDAELYGLLKHARALLFPSFAEGYGMPLAEALALNVPVLASNLPVFREIAGDIPDYLDPLDGPAWLKQIQSYAIQPSHERDMQLARIPAFRESTWAQHFETVDAFLRKLDRIARPAHDDRYC
ncbi:glycosyltransferase family 4 protein [Burkholderia seminalis]|uniref:glycosyltransferase family 4 protein n=1 Tax=Burkholderia seminalis TaxID=488731 RepID=UPI00264E373E|nr:glycosyltransferase family 1 protein [Burkholderia seminalis]MDN7586456.1 glycosyltransferase family 1 protein [Burkholderia seminalis]